MLDLNNLKRIAQEAQDLVYHGKRNYVRDEFDEQITPDVVLEMIKEIEERKAEYDEIYSAYFELDHS